MWLGSPPGWEKSRKIRSMPSASRGRSGSSSPNVPSSHAPATTAARAVPRPPHAQGVQIPLPDDPVEVGVDQGEARRRAPVTEQPGLDVRRPQRLPQQRVAAQVELAGREVGEGTPVRVELRGRRLGEGGMCVHAGCVPGAAPADTPRHRGRESDGSVGYGALPAAPVGGTMAVCGIHGWRSKRGRTRPHGPVQVRRAHEEFLTEGAVAALVRHVVADSWRRCAGASVEPESVARIDLADAELAAHRAAHPLARVMPLFRDLLGTVADDGAHLISVCDATGGCCGWRATAQVRAAPSG